VLLKVLGTEMGKREWPPRVLKGDVVEGNRIAELGACHLDVQVETRQSLENIDHVLAYQIRDHDGIFALDQQCQRQIGTGTENS